MIIKCYLSKKYKDMITILLTIASIGINILIVHLLTKRQGIFNAMAAFVALIPFFGTFLLLSILLIYFWEDLYKK